MKKKYLIGNLKMNMTKAELKPYFESLKEVADNTDNFVGVCVPYVYLCLANHHLADSKVNFGVQNMNSKLSGAYTGEVSPTMLKDFNTKLVIIGHSERRQMYNETDASINEKVKVALANGFTPILCYGETLEERESGIEKERVGSQLKLACNGLSKEDITKIIFAYEPIWAIGTGKTATEEQAEEIICYSKSLIADKFGLTHDDIVILYGGSMKPNNAKALLSQKSIDGGLIGGACLKMEDFKSIIYCTAE